MKLAKKIISSKLAKRILCAIAANYVRFVYLTSRWNVVGDEIPREFWAKNKKFLLCFWHGRLLMMPYCWDKTKPMHVLISMHNDGRLLSETVSYFGIKTIVGSSSRGGASALRAMIKTFKKGDYVGLTPDGPRGPRMQAQEGIITVARLAKVPIIPIAFSSTNSKIFNSWDRFFFALPFGRAVFVWGDPIQIPETNDKSKLEDTRKKVENAINEVTKKADLMCGVNPIEPAILKDEKKNL